MQTVLHRYIAKRSIHDDGTVFTIFFEKAPKGGPPGIYKVTGEDSDRARDAQVAGLLHVTSRDTAAIATFEKAVSDYLGRAWKIDECPSHYEAVGGAPEQLLITTPGSHA